MSSHRPATPRQRPMLYARALWSEVRFLGVGPCVSSSRHAAMATGVPRALLPWTASTAVSSSRGAHRGWTAVPVASSIPGARRGNSAVAAVARDTRTHMPHVFRHSRRPPRAIPVAQNASGTDVAVEALPINLDPTTGKPWVWTLIGCDSDAGGALVVVRGPKPGVATSVVVLDCPIIKVEVNGKLRTRLCVEAMVALVARQRLPPNSVAHVEEGGVEYGFSAQTAFVQGYNFGMWKGVLAGAGLHVKVVKPQAWKNALGLAHKKSSKDESRALAASVFPTVEDLLKRKKDHGRAEALLIAVYGHVALSAFGERSANDEVEAARVSAAAEHEFESAPSPDGDGDVKSAESDVTSFKSNEDPLCARVREVVVKAVETRAALALESGDGSDTECSDDATLRNALGPNDPMPYFGPYFGMSGKALSALARTRRLKVSGKKMELVARLEIDDAERRRAARVQRG